MVTPSAHATAVAFAGVPVVASQAVLVEQKMQEVKEGVGTGTVTSTAWPYRPALQLLMIGTACCVTCRVPFLIFLMLELNLLR